MPALNPVSFLYASHTAEPPKKAPIIKLSCGIGDTDGFPAFDVDSDAYASKDDTKWGFLITGGAEFHMPLTVFQVTPDGLADKEGIRLGDIVLQINEEDATQLTLAQAHEKINESGKKIHFLLKSMDDEDNQGGYEGGEEKSVVLRVPKPPPPPKVCAIERRLIEMQRKLSEIAEIPRILSSTLATVAQTFDKLMPSEPDMMALDPCQYRKFSYDEDAFDYELSESEPDEGDNMHPHATHIREHVRELERDEVDFDFSEQTRGLLKLIKDLTPESDYASETNEVSQQPNDVGDVDDVDDVATDAEEAHGKEAIDYEPADAHCWLNERNAQNEQHEPEQDYENANGPCEHMEITPPDDQPMLSDESDDDDDVHDVDEDHNLNANANAIANDDDGDGDDDDESNVYTIRWHGQLPAAAVDEQNDRNSESDGGTWNEDDTDDNTDDDDDDDDFLSTTFTWSLRNIPKVQLNDRDEAELNEEVAEAEAATESDKHHDEFVECVQQVEKSIDNDQELLEEAPRADHEVSHKQDQDSPEKPDQQIARAAEQQQSKEAQQQQQVEALGQEQQIGQLAQASLEEEKHKKCDKFERSWPWADRTRIIYKQSTCHLVPHKPLGIIEKRIQLLAKQHFLENLRKADTAKASEGK